MRDEQLDAVLRSLDRWVEPDPAFADSLYAALAAEAGFGAAPVGGRRLLPAALGRMFGLAWMLVVVALLMALAAALVVGGRARSPDAIVERSQAAFLAPAPFAMTSRFADGSEATYRFDGTTFRFDVTRGFLGELPEGYYVLRTADREAIYDPKSNEWSTSQNPLRFALLQLQPSWLAQVSWTPGQEPPLVGCDAWELGEEAQVAGRTADEVRCGSDQYWIDRDSGLLVRVIGGGDPMVPDVEVVSLDTDPTFEPGLFAFEPPPGALTGEEPPPLRPRSGVLVPGQRPPTWTGRLLDGGAFSTDDLIGRPAAIFIWCSCYWGAEVQHFVAQARSRAGEIDLVLVGSDREGMVRGLVDWLAVDTPVVTDDTGDLLHTWAIDDLAALVLLRADGTVADLHPPRFDDAKLGAVLDALADGETIPEPDPAPEPLTDAEGRLPTSTVLEVGQAAPELRGPLLGGGELSTLELLARPTVVAFFEPPDPVTGPQTDMPPPDRLLEEVERHGGEVNLLLVAHGEPSPGAANAYLREQSAGAPLIFDWDGSLLRRWGLGFLPTLVLLDADGRVASYYGPQSLADPGPLIDALVNGEALPSPS